MGSGGYLSITDNGGTSLPSLNAVSFDRNSTVEYGSTDELVITTTEGSAVTYGHLITSGSGAKNPGGVLNIAGHLNVGTGTSIM